MPEVVELGGGGAAVSSATSCCCPGDAAVSTGVALSTLNWRERRVEVKEPFAPPPRRSTSLRGCDQSIWAKRRVKPHNNGHPQDGAVDGLAMLASRLLVAVGGGEERGA